MRNQLGPHFTDLFLRSSQATSATVQAAKFSALHGRDIEDYASITLKTADDRIATIEVQYAFPRSPLKRHCLFMRIGPNGMAATWAYGRASLTDVSGATVDEVINVDCDPLNAPFIDAAVDRLADGFAEMPTISDLNALHPAA